jgi:hypothetical protein
VTFEVNPLLLIVVLAVEGWSLAEADGRAQQRRREAAAGDKPVGG